MPSAKPVRKLDEICHDTGTQRETVLHFVQMEWIHAPSEKDELPEEDVLRARLILELQRDFGVNEEAVPIILHLLDQLHAMRRILKTLDLESVAEITLKREKHRAQGT